MKLFDAICNILLYVGMAVIMFLIGSLFVAGSIRMGNWLLDNF